MSLGSIKQTLSQEPFVKALRGAAKAALCFGLAVASSGAFAAKTLPSKKHTAIPQKPLVTPGAKIVGGQIAGRSDYPFMAALVRAGSSDLSFGSFCGASFIGGHYVLTAAHCLQDVVPEEVSVWIGGADLAVPDQGQLIPAYNFYIHEGYQDSALDNDIAIIELAYEAIGAESVALASPELDMGIAEGEPLTILGWGARSDLSDEDFLPFLSELLEAEVPRYNRTQCEAFYEDFFTFGEIGLTDNMMCAGRTEGGVDTCSGDSGGPLLYSDNGQWALAGITSFGDGCGLPESPGVYARVSRYLDWIASNT